jgi:hypothetical protein
MGRRCAQLDVKRRLSARGLLTRPPTPDPSPPRFAWGEGNPAAMPCCAPSRRPGALDAAGAEVGNEGGEDLSEVLRRRRRDKDLPRCGWERVGGVAVENLRRLLLGRALDRLQARAHPGELRRRIRARRRRRQADGFHDGLRLVSTADSKLPNASGRTACPLSESLRKRNAPDEFFR